MKKLTSKNIAKQMDQEFRYRTALKTELGLKPIDLRLLEYLEKQSASCSCAQMQEQLGTNKPRLSESLRRLSNEGFVGISIPINDRRLIDVEISEDGIDALRYAKSIRPRYPIPKKEWEALQNVLRTTSCNATSTIDTAKGGDCNGLDMQSFRILLALLEKQPNTQAGIAAYTRISQPSISKHLKQLQAKELVTTTSKKSASVLPSPKTSSNSEISHDNNAQLAIHRSMLYRLTNRGALLIESILSQLKQ